MRLTPYQSGLLIALLFKRSEASRARLSELTVRKLSGRTKLRTAFLSDLRTVLDDLGLAFLEIERGFALVPLAALNGAPSITAKKLMPELASQIVKGREIDFGPIEDELGVDEDEDKDSDEE